MKPSNMEIPWRNMKGMRNRIAHGHFDIELDVVRETVRAALPDPRRQIEAVREDARTERRRDSEG